MCPRGAVELECLKQWWRVLLSVSLFLYLTRHWDSVAKWTLSSIFLVVFIYELKSSLGWDCQDGEYPSGALRGLGTGTEDPESKHCKRRAERGLLGLEQGPE